MRVEWVNPFLVGAFNVFRQLGFEPDRGEIHLEKSPLAGNEVNVAIGVTGQIKGQVVLGLSIDGAMTVAQTMIPWGVTKFDEMARSSIQELTNMICGAASSNFFQQGIETNLSTPSMFIGKEVEISTGGLESIVIPVIVRSGSGECVVNLAVMLTESSTERGATKRGSEGS